MNVLDLIFSCFNQYLFQDAKNNIRDLEYFFQTNPGTMGNPLVELLVDAIKTYSLESIDEPLFRSILLRSGKSPSESDQILKEIMKWKRFTKEQIEPSRKYLQDVCSSVIIQRASKLYADSPSDYIKYIKNLNIVTSDTEILSATPFTGIDINSIIADNGNSVIPSRYDWINDTFTNRGYERSQLVLISMPPGVGKSLFALSEVTYMAASGYKCLYLAMGDLSYKDQIIRAGAQFSGMNFTDTYRDLGNVYKGMCNVLKDNLDMIIVPADKITAGDFVDYVKNSKKKYDVVCIDYDSNFKSGVTGDGANSMYLEYGSIYSKLTELTMDLGLLVFCLCQPKVGVWNNDTIELSDVGESSRKQHTADICITRSRIDNPNNLGIFKIVKSRRGEVGRKVYSIRLDNGRFIALPKEVFESLKMEKEKRELTEGDINLMIEDARGSSGFIKVSTGNRKQNTPF